MKLEAESVPVLKRLHRKIVALGQQFGADGQFEPFAMPVIDRSGQSGQSAWPASVGRIG